MCGIVGLVGQKNNVVEAVVYGLEGLEYRGYDSAGIACTDSGDTKIICAKACGELSALKAQLHEQPISGLAAIGHTRWATHGRVTLENVHPHFDCSGTIALVHNGIIENYHELGTMLKAEGHIFKSDTDSEVVAHLLESILDRGLSPKKALHELVSRLDGAYALVIMLGGRSDELLFVRKRSPLCLGLGKNKSAVVSDLVAFDADIEKYAIIPDQTYGFLRMGEVEAYSFDGFSAEITYTPHIHNASSRDRGGHAHYMLKEIYEQKGIVHRIVTALNDLGDEWIKGLGYTSASQASESLKKLTHVDLIACGTSYYAASLGAFFLRDIAGIDTSVTRASEFAYNPILMKNRLYGVVSQSGETADTLEVLRALKRQEQSVFGIVNVEKSSMAREADGFFAMHAGPEISVASTKSFTAQVVVFYWLALKIAHSKGLITLQQLQASEAELLWCGNKIEETLENNKSSIEHDAAWFAQYKTCLFLGRQESFILAAEAALKLKELAYIFVEAFPSGELKHGPLALVDQNMPVVVFSSADPLVYQKIVSNAQEVKARGGRLVVFGFQDQTALLNLAEKSYCVSGFSSYTQCDSLLGPLCMVAAMHYLVYSIAKVLERPIDKPRNLAKSVTVE